MASDNPYSEAQTVIEKFDGNKNFSLWQVWMKDVMIQQGDEEAFNDKANKHTEMTDKLLVSERGCKSMISNNSFSETRTMIEKFDGKKNFSLWQMRMKDVLIQQGVEETLNNKDNKHTEMTDKSWEKMNSKAASTIRMGLTDDVVYDVIEETSAKDLWKKLEDLYMRKDFNNHLLLKQELYSLKRKEGVDLQSHISEFNKLLYDLSNVGVKLDDEDKALILLASVKSTHSHIFNTLLYGRNTITVEQVKRTLFSCDKMEREDDKSKDILQTLATQEKKTNWKKNSINSLLKDVKTNWKKNSINSLLKDVSQVL